MKPKIAIPLGVAGMLVGTGTAIANANHLFDNHPALAYWFYGAAIILIVVAVTGWILDARKQPDIASVKESSSPQPASQDVKQEANPQINSHVNPQFNISVGNSSASAVPAPERTEKAEECNIHFTGLRSDVQQIRTPIGLPTGQSAPYSTAVFENQAIEGKALLVPTVKARAIFRNASGDSVFDLSNIAWVPGSGNTYATMEANTPRYLLLFSATVNGKLLCRTVQRSGIKIGGRRQNVKDWQEYVIPRRFVTVEIQLLTTTELLYGVLLEFKDDGTTFPEFIGFREL